MRQSIKSTTTRLRQPLYPRWARYLIDPTTSWNASHIKEDTSGNKLPWQISRLYQNCITTCLKFRVMPLDYTSVKLGTINNKSRYSLLAEVSHDEANWNDGRETSAGFRRVVWWSRRPHFWSKLTGFQNRFRLMRNARALLDWTLIIIEPTVDYGFREFRNFSLWSSHKIVCFYAWR